MKRGHPLKGSSREKTPLHEKKMVLPVNEYDSMYIVKRSDVYPTDHEIFSLIPSLTAWSFQDVRDG